MATLFEYHKLGQRLGISADRLSQLEACLRSQHGSDEMMFELRMLRTLRAIEEGATTIDAAIREFSADIVRGPAGAG